jgi:hypothetical protein
MTKEPTARQISDVFGMVWKEITPGSGLFAPEGNLEEFRLRQDEMQRVAQYRSELQARRRSQTLPP